MALSQLPRVALDVGEGLPHSPPGSCALWAALARRLSRPAPPGSVTPAAGGSRGLPPGDRAAPWKRGWALAWLRKPRTAGSAPSAQCAPRGAARSIRCGSPGRPASTPPDLNPAAPLSDLPLRPLGADSDHAANPQGRARQRNTARLSRIHPLAEREHPGARVQQKQVPFPRVGFGAGSSPPYGKKIIHFGKTFSSSHPLSGSARLKEFTLGTLIFPKKGLGKANWRDSFPLCAKPLSRRSPGSLPRKFPMRTGVTRSKSLPPTGNGWPHKKHAHSFRTI